MLTYTIKLNNYAIGQAKGKHSAFEFIQKEIDRKGTLGYWCGDKYIGKDGDSYSMEVASA